MHCNAISKYTLYQYGILLIFRIIFHAHIKHVEWMNSNAMNKMIY